MSRASISSAIWEWKAFTRSGSERWWSLPWGSKWEQLTSVYKKLAAVAFSSQMLIAWVCLPVDTSHQDQLIPSPVLCIITCWGSRLFCALFGLHQSEHSPPDSGFFCVHVSAVFPVSIVLFDFLANPGQGFRIKLWGMWQRSSVLFCGQKSLLFLISLGRQKGDYVIFPRLQT